MDLSKSKEPLDAFLDGDIVEAEHIDLCIFSISLLEF